MKDKILNYILAICVGLIVVISIYELYKPSILTETAKVHIKVGNSYNKFKVRQSEIRPRVNDDYTGIKINKPVNFSYMPKEQIYKLRNNAVQDSIFRNYYYKPSEYVFGQIISGKPWISVNGCWSIDGDAEVDNLSEESRFILNPSILVHIDYPMLSSRTKDNQNFCNLQNNFFTRLLPTSAEYSKQNNRITTTYSQGLPYGAETYKRDVAMGAYQAHYNFNGINARDLGYRYVYLDKSKSKLNNTIFIGNNNISNNVQEFKNFIHLGGSCRVEGGCNNGSPYQSELGFMIGNRSNQKLYKYYLKLWKNKPASPEDEADIVQIIRIIQ